MGQRHRKSADRAALLRIGRLMVQDSIKHVLAAEASRMGIVMGQRHQRSADRAALLRIGRLMGQRHQRSADRGSVND